MTKNSVAAFGVLLVSLVGLVLLYQKVMELEKENRFLRSQQTELEDRLTVAQGRIGELEKDNKSLQEGSALLVAGFPAPYGKGTRLNTPVSAALETHIDGVFDGWDGKTVFRMKDGSRWQQDEYSVAYHVARSPKVVLYYKNGGTYMQVEGMNEEVRVRKVK